MDLRWTRSFDKEVIVFSLKRLLNGFRAASSDQRRIFISGTGRAGTSYLVQLFTRLGFDTGSWTDEAYSPTAHAGFERDIFDPNGPRIIKSPFLCGQVDAVISGGIAIDHVIIPVRRIDDAAASRVAVQKATTGAGDGTGVIGGLWDTEFGASQADVLRVKLTSLIEALVRHDIPMTFIAFPRSTTDADYLFRKLAPLMPGVSEAAFRRAFAEVARPELVHDFGGQGSRSAEPSHKS